ncbi:MAG: LPS-assembly protein LptD [Candidatus Omnitrophica bacterium]|nr:LPS-assembly protein LptD [Candidatus Omnitrophota bacterium]MDE2232404.1 LPS-assembly protein LptD [Candidatus Omnitrophota bacterium]
MRKGSFSIFWITVGFLVGASLLFLAREAIASPLKLPDIKSQFNKKSLKPTSKMDLQADQISFSSSENKAHAKGHVTVKNGAQELFCDELTLERAIRQVEAEGDVYLATPQEQVIAQGLTYNFNKRTGEFRDARVYMYPYQIVGKKIDKVSANHYILQQGYLTTSDWDKPDFRIEARRIDIYPRDKAVIRGMKVYLGSVPLMYLPYYSESLKNRPMFTFVPGDNKNFGLFLLTTTRFQTGSHVQVSLHADVRERTGFGEGADVRYNTPNFGSGLLSVYRADENLIAGSHLWNSTGPTQHHTLYRVIWRHHWQIDPNTDVVLQEYRIHDYDIVDNRFLKLYFPREYQQAAQDSNFDSYFLLTHNMPHGTLIFDVDTSRQNPALRGVERIPQVQYILNNQQIGNTGFYAKSTDTFSDLTYQNYPKTFNEKTLRFDSNDDISHPFKVGFISFNPHAGGEETYYSRTADINDNNIFRGLFRGSLDMSTRFFRVWNTHTNFAGLNINRLRHVITPTITYLYQTRPSFSSSELNQFDPSIDNLYRIHQFEFSLLNELQTKRHGEVVDLARFQVLTNFGLKGTALGEPQVNTLGPMAGLSNSRRGFNPFDSILDVNPTDWLTFHNDNEYDFHYGHWNSENFDGQVHGAKWAFALGNRYTRGEGDQVTTQWNYTINPLWSFMAYEALPVTQPSNGSPGNARETEFVLTRDLHEWQMDLTVDRIEGQGSAFYVLFRLKAAPGMKFNLLQSTFQPSRAGAQK